MESHAFSGSSSQDSEEGVGLDRWRPLPEALNAHTQFKPKLGHLPCLSEPPVPRTFELMENYRSIFTVSNMRTISSSSVLGFVLDL